MAKLKPDNIWTVSALNRATKDLLHDAFGVIWIEAEVSNLARPASGHLYFSLKDDRAQLRAAFFRQRHRGGAADIGNGDQVLVRGRLSLYEPRGDYQLIVEHLEPAGEGALRRAFEQLKRKLASEGLFDEARKRPLPALPRRIGVITSPSGAAVRDVLKVLARRLPLVPVTVFAASVQGHEAPSSLRRALRLAVERNDCDVLILTRGGGSLEDLAAFNDEGLARDIAQSPIPTIAGVGHETDFSIADFVADLRAPTPSAAAELATPDRADLLRRIAEQRRRLAQRMETSLQQQAQRLDRYAHRLAVQSPSRRLLDQRERLRRLTQAMLRAQLTGLASASLRQRHLTARLRSQTPARLLSARMASLSLLRQRLVEAGAAHPRRHSRRLAVLAGTLQAVSPLATIGRGYAVVRRADETPLTDAATATLGERLDVRLRDGAIEAEVKSIRLDSPKE